MAKKAKTRQLPFVVQPRLEPIQERIGNENSGMIEIERRGYLTVAEKAWLQALEADDGTQGKLHRLAIKVGAELSMDPREALDLISSSQLQDSRLIPFHAELMAVLNEMAAFQSRRRLISATCMIFSRLDPSWTIDDTLSLHTDIIDGLDTLYNEEEARSIEALEAARDTKGSSEEQSSGKE